MSNGTCLNGCDTMKTQEISIGKIYLFREMGRLHKVLVSEIEKVRVIANSVNRYKVISVDEDKSWIASSRDIFPIGAVVENRSAARVHGKKAKVPNGPLLAIKCKCGKETFNLKGICNRCL